MLNGDYDNNNDDGSGAASLTALPETRAASA
jgi:hypothetical protein